MFPVGNPFSQSCTDSKVFLIRSEFSPKITFEQFSILNVKSVTAAFLLPTGETKKKLQKNSCCLQTVKEKSALWLE